MKNNIRKNRRKLIELFNAISATDNDGKNFSLDEALEKVIGIILRQVKRGGRILFIGNGGSASIASHMATDFIKNAGISAMAFNDSSLLTCISNDCGYEHVFEKPIALLAEPEDVLVAISSSGRSENILRGVKKAETKGVKVVTLSGFDKNNPLRKLGRINFYVPSISYGQVEITHLYICHCLVDTTIEQKNG